MPARFRAARPIRRGQRRRTASAALSALAVAVATFLPVTAAQAEPENTPASPGPVTPSVQDVSLGDFDDPSAAPGAQLSTPDGGQTVRLSVSRPETAAFSTVGVSWAYAPDSGEGGVTVEVRTKAATGAWGGWQSLDVEDGAAPNPAAADLRGGTAPYWTGPSTGAEVAITAPAGESAPRDLRLTLIDPKRSPADALPEAAPTSEAATYGVPQPFIYTRLAWGADEGLRTWPPEYSGTLKAAIIHHTADRNDYTAEEVPGMLRAIYYYHSVTLGWGDIGYNFIVDKFGRVFEGRYGGVESTVVGGHALGFNPYTTGISMLGNYEEVEAPTVMIDAVSSIVAWKFGLYGLDPHAQTELSSSDTTLTVPVVLGHRDVNNTLCPGQYGYARLPEIRDKAAAQLAASVVSAPVDAPQAVD